jgi:uncharacterized membrane protein YcaP (DUF421 family)
LETLLNIDWRSMFVPTESVFEVIVRGTIMYVGMFALLRIFRRQAGSVGIADLLVIVVIADAAQNGMAGESKSITEALLLILTIVVWDWVFDLLGFKSKFWSGVFEPEPLLLVKNGRIIRKNLEKELISEDDLKSQLRQQGVEDLSSVKKVYLESNGHFSVLTETPGQPKQKGNDKQTPTVN